MTFYFTPLTTGVEVGDKYLESISELSPYPTSVTYGQEYPNKYVPTNYNPNLYLPSTTYNQLQFTPLSTDFSELSPITVNLDYSKPLISYYETIDQSPQIIKTMVSHYYYKVLDNWLLNELSDVLNFFTFRDGRVDMIKDLSQYNSSNINTDTDEIAAKKVDFIQSEIFTKYDMMNILKKFVKEAGIKYVNLPKNEFQLRQAVKEYLIKELKGKIKYRNPEQGRSRRQ